MADTSREIPVVAQQPQIDGEEQRNDLEQLSLRVCAQTFTHIPLTHCTSNTNITNQTQM